MKIAYDAEVDMLTIRLVSREEFKARFDHDDSEAFPGAVISTDQQGAILEIEVWDASKKYPLEILSANPARYDDPLTLADAAHVASTTPEALKKAIERGRLGGRKIGRDWTTTTAELTEYLNSRKHAGPGSKAIA